MSKADQLGAGRFGGAARTVSARRQAVASATGVPTEGVAPPTELPPHRISLNPDNPRSSLGDLTDLAGSLKDHGQKVAITVMNRDAYLRANPRREADLEPNTSHVVIDGSSRLAAARDAGLTTIKVMVDDDQGSDEEELLESALVANIHRQALDPMDEARALKRLLDIHGSQRALAKRLHRSQGWVSQRLALLGLTPELAQHLENGTENVDLLRAVGNKPPEQQQEALDELKRARAAKEVQRKNLPEPAAGLAPAEPPAGDYGVITPASSPQPQPRPNPATPAPVPAPQNAPATENIPEPRDATPRVEQAERSEPKLFPYDDGHEAGLLLLHKMPPEERARVYDMLGKDEATQAARVS
jgi:ParB family chromosome partitioning protein